MLFIKDLREYNTKSVDEIADALCIDKQKYLTYEQENKVPLYEHFIVLSNIFHIGMDIMFDAFICEYSSKKIKMRVCEVFYECNDININTLEKDLGTNYMTFKVWCEGTGDYFNSFDKLLRVAQALNISIDYLIGATDKKSEFLKTPDKSQPISNINIADNHGMIGTVNGNITIKK